MNIFEQLGSPEDLDNLLALEALTNDRLREVARAIDIVPLGDRVNGPGASFIMAPFAYVSAGRFAPRGIRGAYYAGRALSTAIAETSFHRARFLRDTHERPHVAEQRVIEASINGRFVKSENLTAKEQRSSLDANTYLESYAIGERIYAQGDDGITYPSVRHEGGRCIAVFRPRCIRKARTTMYLGYRWNGDRINDVFAIASLGTNYPDEPGLR